MSKNKSAEELRKEQEVTNEKIARLKNKQVRTRLHLEMQRQGATRDNSTWFVAGSDD